MRLSDVRGDVMANSISGGSLCGLWYNVQLSRTLSRNPVLCMFGGMECMYVSRFVGTLTLHLNVQMLFRFATIS